MSEWIKQSDGVWTRVEGRMSYVIRQYHNGFVIHEEKAGCRPNSVDHYLNSSRSLGFQLTLEKAQQLVESHIGSQPEPLNILRCPVCGAEERSRSWRFVSGPGGGGWMCDCGAMWRSWSTEDILDRRQA